MTRHLARPAQSRRLDRDDADLLASLWEQADFPRLPEDAPPELKDYVEEIENPKRVYAVYRASRRHNFQLLVEKYVTQLRSGCGSISCTTPTCFSCRKRLVGKAPIKRYNITSARTLATYLASQDSPENGLCPNLRSPREAPAALNALLLTPKRPPATRADSASKKMEESTSGGFRRGKPGVDSKSPHGRSSPESRPTHSTDGFKWLQPGEMPEHRIVYPPRDSPKFMAAERQVNKDYRSFAANVFNTVAFKMVEWLTPNALESLTQKVSELQGKDLPKGHATAAAAKPEPAPKQESFPESPILPRSPTMTTSTSAMDEGRDPIKESMPDRQQERGPGIPVPQERATTASKHSRPRKNSNARVRTPSTSKPKRKVSIDPFAPQTPSDDVPGLVSPRLSGPPPDWVLPPPPKPGQARPPRPIPEIPATPGFFDHVKAVPPTRVEVKAKNERAHSAEEQRPTEKKESQLPVLSLDRKVGDKSQDEAPPGELTPAPQSIHDSFLPQSLNRLNPEIIDLFCDITRDKGTFEIRQFEPEMNHPFDNLTMRKGYLGRVGSPEPYPHRLVLEWKMFIEQSLFNVLTDPRALITSFSRDNQVFDSQSLWYCMMRMVKVTPSLVFDCLWVVSASLFAPPKSLQSLRSPTGKVFPKPERSLTNTEAGRLMAICFHALVAAAPLATTTTELYDVSRIRSSGQIFEVSRAGSRQPPWVCLRYEDMFANELCIRLARRLFTAIIARRRFGEMVDQDESNEETAEDLDVLQPLLRQIDFLNEEKPPILEFPAPLRLIHETRVPTLLLDWARTVMLNEWNGSAEFPANGPFAGAVSLIAAMHDKRQSLLLGDTHFRLDYFADRLDSVDMPVAWLNFMASKQKSHLLDYPYMFHPDTLVSYFRSINFARMSRAYEESSSLHTRMHAIVAPESLITNPHHKQVLQDLLKTASCRYLILDISRKNVIRDAFDQLWQREERELLRPLKVHLGEETGEEGFDSGGVQQEFLRLAIAECLNPDYGAFTVDPRTRMAWFVPGSIVDTWKFELIGLLMSIAIYNGLTLPITFPKALYRKLLGEPVNELHHIADGWPELTNGLTMLEEWDEKDGLVEDIFARTYEFSVSAFGQPVSREMNTANPQWPQFSASQIAAPPSAENPFDAPLVTDDNRHAYVSDYIQYLTDVSVRPQYEALERGFKTCLHAKSLQLLSPPLLQNLVEGEQEIDIAELRRYTRYVGWDASHRTVKDFWSIVKRYNDRMKRRLLEFVTASDRVPVGGLKNLQFVLQRNGEEEGRGGHLPTAYTCYGTLLLPEYRDREILKERLGMALQNAQGFGFA